MAKAVEKAYQLIRERIVSGEYAPAFRLTEQEIADSSGVSRTPVREALRRLQAEGLVQVVSNQSAVVVDWSDVDSNEVFELRALLEPYGAARAAMRATKEEIEYLRELAKMQYEECERRPPGFMNRVGEMNSRFHKAILDIAGSPRLSVLMPVLIDAPLVMRTFAKYEPVEMLRSAAHHLEIVAAIEAKDSEWATAIMKSHIHAAQHSLQRELAQLKSSVR
ncbi:MAG: GntR family transcriptional regulator [Xanthomonadales bacterium]|nr:GntR family transcriptional regulator [Xanthomonadales bacterium]